MSISRMFTVNCDICMNDNGGHWWRSAAILDAKKSGWYVASTGAARCPECVEASAGNN